MGIHCFQKCQWRQTYVVVYVNHMDGWLAISCLVVIMTNKGIFVQKLSIIDLQIKTSDAARCSFETFTLVFFLSDRERIIYKHSTELAHGSSLREQIKENSVSKITYWIFNFNSCAPILKTDKDNINESQFRTSALQYTLFFHLLRLRENFHDTLLWSIEMI